MAKLIVCERCKQVVEYEPVIEHKAGMVFTKYECPKCGYIKESNTNHIHYGNDGTG